MKRVFDLVLVGGLVLGLAVFGRTVAYAEEGAPAETEHKSNFIDENGDGYNDNAPDHDGDGIPNGRDSDYVKPGMGRGPNGFIDEDGDGINDLAGNRQRVENKGGLWQRIASRFRFLGRGDKQNQAEGNGPGEGLRSRDQDWSGPDGRPQGAAGRHGKNASGRRGNRANPDAGNGVCGGGNCPLE